MRLLKLYLAGKSHSEEKPAKTASSLETPVVEVSEQKLADMVAYWEQEIKMAVTPAIYERMQGWADEYPIEQYKKAVDIAIERKVRSPAPYIDKILLNQNGSLK